MTRRITIKNHIRESRLFKHRLIASIIVIMIFAILLIARLCYLQIVRNQHYTTLSTTNEITLVPIAPRRGIIYDRNGVILAKNIPVFSLMAQPNHIKDLKKAIVKLKSYIALSNNDLDQFYKQLKQHRRFDLIPLKLKLTETEVARFAVNQYQFPGFSIHAQLIRQYPFKDAMAHVLGYVGRINEQDLTQVDTSNYAATNFIGKVGIEKYYETQLHGKVGSQKIETDANGQTIRTLDRLPPVKGEDLYLTIDSKLQLAAKNALTGHPGAVVAIQPSTGQVLALVSQPSYNPNDFVIGISSKSFQKLQHNTKHPLYNRALRGLYPPGSTIKPFMALGGLNAKAITPSTKIFDPGWYRIPGTHHIYKDWAWRRGGHGWINVSNAIIQSCDTYFYILAHKLGIQRIDDILEQFGFGQPTGIDMGEELAGNVPTPAWKLRTVGTGWFPGDTVLAGFGQGYLQTTPLQLAAATATLANRGVRNQPTLLDAEKLPDGTIQKYQTVQEDPVMLQSQHYWDVVLKSMQGVITRGTGFKFGKPSYTVAAKTGTAQVYSQDYDEYAKDLNIPEQLRDNSVFIAFAPYKHPKIAIAVVIEHNLDAPVVARKILDYYLLTEGHLKDKANTRHPET